MRRPQPDPFDVADNAPLFVAQITGLKQQLIDAGWSPDAAEQIVIAAIKDGFERTR